MHLYFSSLYFIVIRENRMSSKFVACIGKGGQRDMAESFARRTGTTLLDKPGEELTLYEQNPVVAVLLKDALRRAKKHPKLKDIAARMQLVEGNSIDELKSRVDDIDLIYLDPMFPGRQKSGLINKKLQLIQKLEPPCSDEVKLFEAAIQAKPSKIIVKRPLKSPFLAGKNPTYELKGKAIRYDCYAL